MNIEYYCRKRDLNFDQLNFCDKCVKEEKSGFATADACRHFNMEVLSGDFEDADI